MRELSYDEKMDKFGSDGELDIAFQLGSFVEENVCCSECKKHTNDEVDNGKYKEDISYTIDGFCIVKKIYTCFDCLFEKFCNKNK